MEGGGGCRGDKKSSRMKQPASLSLSIFISDTDTKECASAQRAHSRRLSIHTYAEMHARGNSCTASFSFKHIIFAHSPLLSFSFPRLGSECADLTLLLLCIECCDFLTE